MPLDLNDPLRMTFRVDQGGFSPRFLFANGEPGDTWWFWRDFCYTKTAGGVYERVTTTGDAIARMVGVVNGIFADQDDETKRPLYGESGAIGWALYDGINDAMQTPLIDFTGTDEMTVCVGMRKRASPNQLRVLVELSPNAFDVANPGSFNLLGAVDATKDFQIEARGTAYGAVSTTVFDAAGEHVLTGLIDFSDDLLDLRVDTTSVGEFTGDFGVSNFGNYALNFGARNGTGLFHNDRIHTITVRGALTSGANLAALETWTNQRTGAY